MALALNSTDVCVPCTGRMERPRPDGGLFECCGVPAVGLHPSGHRIHLAFPHRHLPLPLHPLPPRLQGASALSGQFLLYVVTTVSS